MIRIELLARKKRGRSPVVALLAVCLLAVVAVGGLYWVDQRYPLRGVWNDLWEEEGEEVAFDPVLEGEEVATAGVESAKADSPLAAVVEEMSATATGVEGEPADSPAATEMETGDEQEMRAVDLRGEAEVADTVAAGVPEAVEEAARDTIRESGGRAVEVNYREGEPRWSSACLWAMKVSERMPVSTRLTSLTCRASGEYSLEGMSSSHREVEGFLETLQQLPSKVSLSWWREGRLRIDHIYRYKFSFQGQFQELYTHGLEAVSSTQAKTLSKKIADWSRGSGLKELSLKEPIEVRLDAERMRHRYKIWATGSYRQIGAFLQQLEQVEDIAGLVEVVIVPVYHGGENWTQARLYAVVDLLLQR